MNQINKKIIFLSGAASTGKSSVLEKLKEILPADTYFQSSITRSFYKLKQIDSEIAIINNFNEQQKKQFQIEYLDYYLNYTFEKIKQSKGEYCVIDRSALDILAWTIYDCPNLSKKQYDEIILKINKFWMDIKKDNRVFIFSFPLFSFGNYLPWLNENIGNSSDGFRYDPFSKNFTIEGILNNLHKQFNSFYIFQNSLVTNISDRANRIYSFVKEY